MFSFFYEQPTLVNLHLKNGKRPEFDVYIGRAVEGTEFTEDSIYANHYKNLIDYRLHILNTPSLMNNLEDLSGQKLGCWCITTSLCKPFICHGQILIMLWIEIYGKC